ncbi:hypothetical protein DBR32_09740 [Taibaiella sp. KBW10]|uniref:hypothetical protein n=1 Tax=Taibaiella sp. KBW10 TaxID=2153357 RepID=UPI000F58FA11|nr:hypothetical protein [Taibaiella sp. KBW10]RQO30979.1 hypothetical protein DBR32_09740 [Taibaiella sp. KBW10]
MSKFIFLTIPTMLLLSCNETGNSNKAKPIENQTIQKDKAVSENVFWHKNQVIEQVIKETDSLYIVQIGIMAQSFQLEQQHNAHFNEDLKLLKKSLSERIKVNIGIENGSNKIISVTER